MRIKKNMSVMFTLILLSLNFGVTADEYPFTTATGPVAGTVMSPAYAQSVGRLAYVWGWPLVNMHNRREAFRSVTQHGYLGGAMPVSPINRLGMLYDYVSPEMRHVAHPNQDVVYGFGILSLDESPVVLQVPDFGDRYWLFEIADQRTDGVSHLGKLFDTNPGFYLIVGHDWHGETPDGITAVLRSPTNMGVVIPRIFMSDTAADREVIQPLVQTVMMYPLAEFDGTMKRTDWKTLPVIPDPDAGKSNSERKWVTPEAFFKQLPVVLDEVPPLPGEEALYQQFRSVVKAAQAQPEIMQALIDVARETEEKVIDPLFYFHNVGVTTANYWTRPFNNAAFGTDYLTRTAMAKSNMFVNHYREASYLYQYRDGDGNRLNGSNRYTLTFSKDQLPPVDGFWSLTMYNESHFFYLNELQRYSQGTKNKALKYAEDGSLTLYIQNERPSEDKVSNWLPAPDDVFAITLRAYGPRETLVTGDWAPPAVTRTN